MAIESTYMRVSLNAPTALLSYMDLSREAFLCLAQYAKKDAEYFSYFAKKASLPNSITFIDQAIVEGERPIPNTEYIKLAREIGVRYIFATDSWGDTSDSMKLLNMQAFYDFINVYKSMHDVQLPNILVVPHAYTATDWIDQMHQMINYANEQHITISGVGICGDDVNPADGDSGREEVLKLLLPQRKDNFYIHLLGSYHSYICYSKPIYNEVNSLDTSSPLWHGLNAIRIGKNGCFDSGRLKEHLPYEITKITEEVIMCGKKRIVHIKNLEDVILYNIAMLLLHTGR